MRAMAGNGLMFQNEARNHHSKIIAREKPECSILTYHGNHDARVDLVPIRYFRTRPT